jgi:hypothetical protein
VFDKEGNQWSKTVHTIEEFKDNYYYVSDRKTPYKVYELLMVKGNTKEQTEQQVDDDKEEEQQRQTRLSARRLKKEGVERNLESRPKRIPRSTDLGAVITTQYGRRNK